MMQREGPMLTLRQHAGAPWPLVQPHHHHVVGVFRGPCMPVHAFNRPLDHMTMGYVPSQAHTHVQVVHREVVAHLELAPRALPLPHTWLVEPRSALAVLSRPSGELHQHPPVEGKVTQHPGATQPVSQNVCAAPRCPAGHSMRAKVAREMWKRVMAWRYRGTCDRCETHIGTKDASYVCGKCMYVLCLACSEHRVASTAGCDIALAALHAFPGSTWRPPNHVMPGDIFFCGPDKWGIHHVVLCRGPMQAEHDCELLEALEVNEEEEVFSCLTIESSRPLKGVDVHWYPARTYFSRTTYGESAMLADVGDDTDTLCLHAKPTPVKILLHPFRGPHALRMDAFQEAVARSAKASRRWGLRTALKALTAWREPLRVEEYPDAESRAELLEDLRRRWGHKPICSSVAIMVWQRYFEIAAGAAAESETVAPEAVDIAAREIIRWMPALSDKTMPSALLKALSQVGWVLRGNLDGPIGGTAASRS
mmetsp:Transcript_115810/g.327600  ORF Transcript_115810/g.327600 Transcript_115810/m.327600 type:complete len:479 (-) Transcript_115810:17-1453(-)